MKKLFRTPTARSICAATLCCVTLGVVYALSVCWRVADAELRVYKRNHIFKTLNRDSPDYTEPASALSYGGRTYRIKTAGHEIVVHKQLVNGFQHAYGSALAAFELGEWPSDIAFRAVEYFEAYTTKGGRTYQHLLDTKKDLYNNSVGRRIALTAHAKALTGSAADQFMQQEILRAIDRGDIISDFMDPKVKQLPELAAFGCWGLPNPQSTASPM
jgi:hypothetical protein